MKLLFDTLSEAHVDYIKTSLSALKLNLAEGRKIEDTKFLYPHATYDATLHDILSGEGTFSFQRTGVRVLCEIDGVLIGAVETSQLLSDIRNGRGKFHFESGPLVTFTEEAFRKLLKVVMFPEDTWLTGLVRIASIDVTAIWMRGKTSNWFTLIGKVPPDFVALQLYPEKEFIEQLAQLNAGNSPGKK